MDKINRNESISDEEFLHVLRELGQKLDEVVDTLQSVN